MKDSGEFLRRELKNLKDTIRSSISAAMDKFQNSTGVAVSGIDVELVSVDEMGSDKVYVLSDVIVEIEI